MELKTIKDAFDHVTMKQRLSCSETKEVIDQISHEIEQAIGKMQLASGSDSDVVYKSILGELKNKFKKAAPLSQLGSPQKELNISMSKYSKLLEKSFYPDISKAYRNVEFDTHTIDQIIASHFYREGLLDVGDCFVNETGKSESAAAMKSPFQEMFRIGEALRSMNLEPAFNWEATNSGSLRQKGLDIGFKLHRMQFLQIVTNGKQDKALAYARRHIAPFACDHMPEIQQLMACILWTGKLNRSPYSGLLSSSSWNKVAEDFILQFCLLMGLSSKSPLSVAVAAGVQGLPRLLKFMSVMVAGKREWQSMQQSAVPVDLDREFQFHSIFVCPVSKEHASKDNPPMLLSCKHALCKQSIKMMSNDFSQNFRCPYCPAEILDATTQSRQIYL